MAAFDITSANATVTLVADGLFSTELQQFADGDSFEIDSIQTTETRIGVDGVMVAGQTPGIYIATIHLEANSPSREYLSTLKAAMETNHKPYECSIVLSIPSIGERHTLSRGVLHDYTPTPAGKKVLDPITAVFHFNFHTQEGI